MVPLSMILSDLSPTFQGHDNIQRLITRIIVSCIYYDLSNVPVSSDLSDPERRFQGHGDALDELCAQLTRDLFAVAKFLSKQVL